MPRAVKPIARNTVKWYIDVFKRICKLQYHIVKAHPTFRFVVALIDYCVDYLKILMISFINADECASREFTNAKS